VRRSPQHPCASRYYNNKQLSLLGVSGAGLRSRRRRFAPDAGFSRRFPGRDRGLGSQGVGLRRAEGRGVAGRDPGPKRGPLVGRVASLDAIHSVGLVGERRPAGARARCGCWWRVGWAACSVPAGSRQVVENAGLGLLWRWAKPGHVPVARVALARVFVGSAASHRRTAIQMYGVSCGLLPATTHPSRTPLSLA
jgi:hypothetical protein